MVCCRRFVEVQLSVSSLSMVLIAVSEEVPRAERSGPRLKAANQATSPACGEASPSLAASNLSPMSPSRDGIFGSPGGHLPFLIKSPSPPLPFHSSHRPPQHRNNRHTATYRPSREHGLHRAIRPETGIAPGPAVRPLGRIPSHPARGAGCPGGEQPLQDPVIDIGEDLCDRVEARQCQGRGRVGHPAGQEGAGPVGHDHQQSKSRRLSCQPHGW